MAAKFGSGDDDKDKSDEEVAASDGEGDEVKVDDETSKAKAYQQAFNKGNKNIKIAFFYRKDVTDEIRESIQTKHDDYFEALRGRIVTLFSDPVKRPEKREIEEFIKKETAETKRLGLMEPVQETIATTIGQTVNNLFRLQKFDAATIKEQLDEVLDDGINEGIENESFMRAYEQFFDDTHDNLAKKGLVYVLPQGVHKWLYNAAWLQGHFHKGTDTFIIKTPIDRTSILRGKTSEHSGDVGSGFYREIAVCYLLGYKLQTNGEGDIFLKHPSIQDLKNIELDAILKYSVEDMKIPYENAIKDYNTFILQSLNDELRRLESYERESLETYETRKQTVVDLEKNDKKGVLAEFEVQEENRRKAYAAEKPRLEGEIKAVLEEIRRCEKEIKDIMALKQAPSLTFTHPSGAPALSSAPTALPPTAPAKKPDDKDSSMSFS